MLSFPLLGDVNTQQFKSFLFWFGIYSGKKALKPWEKKNLKVKTYFEKQFKKTETNDSFYITPLLQTG